MPTTDSFSKLALAFEQAMEQPHFEKTFFRVNKKIFATMDEKNGSVVVKLSAVDQSVFCAFDKKFFYPVPGGWGILKDILTTSYCNVAPEKLAENYKQ